MPVEQEVLEVLDGVLAVNIRYSKSIGHGMFMMRFD